MMSFTTYMQTFDPYKIYFCIFRVKSSKHHYSTSNILKVVIKTKKKVSNPWFLSKFIEKCGRLTLSNVNTIDDVILMTLQHHLRLKCVYVNIGSFLYKITKIFETCVWGGHISFWNKIYDANKLLSFVHLFLTLN